MLMQSMDITAAEHNTDNADRAGGRRTRFPGFVLTGLGVLVMALMVSLCLALVVPRYFGYSSYIVASGSMEPAIPTGSVVYSRHVDPADLEAGDIIVFANEARRKEPITHRVVNNNRLTGTLITKGDANSHYDVDPVLYSKVLGRVDRYVPYIGYAASMFGTAAGKVAVLIILAVAWVLTEAGGRLRRQSSR